MAKREDPTLRSEANGFGNLGTKLVDFLCGETTQAVCSVQNPHRSIVFAARIEMETDREHLPDWTSGATQSRSSATVAQSTTGSVTAHPAVVTNC